MHLLTNRYIEVYQVQNLNQPGPTYGIVSLHPVDMYTHLLIWRRVDGSIRFPEDKLHLINRTVDLGNDRTLKSWHDGKGGYQ